MRGTCVLWAVAKIIVPVFHMGKPRPREGVVWPHLTARRGLCWGPEPRVPLRCGQEAQGLVGQADLVVWETVLTAKTSLQTLRASDHLGSGTGLSGFRCGTRM